MLRLRIAPVASLPAAHGAGNALPGGCIKRAGGHRARRIRPRDGTRWPSWHCDCFDHRHPACRRRSVMTTRGCRLQIAAWLALAALAIVAVRPATAAGATAFKLRLQPVTLLYYYSAIDLTLDSTALAKLATPAAGTALP